MSRPYPVAPPPRQKIPVCETPIPTSIKKAVPFFNPREFWSWGANPEGSNCRQLDTIIEKPVPPTPLNVCTYAGSSNAEAGDDDGIVNIATFAFPIGIAVDSSGNMYVADSGNHKIKKIDTSGFVTTYAGTGISGFVNGSSLSASFWNPTGVAVSRSGNVYVADSLNNSIRKISNGVVTTLAGSSTAGFADGTGTSALFNFPFDLAVDLSDNLYIVDALNNNIRYCTSNGNVTRFAGGAGSNNPGFADGDKLTNAKFLNPTSVALNLSTNVLYITDTTNNAIRVVSGNNVSTVLTNYYAPVGGSFDSKNNYYFAEQGSNRIIKISSNGSNTIFAGDGTEGFQNGFDVSSSFSFPFKVCAITPSLAYVADNQNNVIRRISSFVNSVTEILTITSISPYQYSLPQNANLAYSIIGGGGGGAIGSNAGGGGGGGSSFVNGYIPNINSGTIIEFIVGGKGDAGRSQPNVPPRDGSNTFFILNGQTFTSIAGSAAVQTTNISVGGNGGSGAYGGGGGYGSVTRGSGGSGTIETGKNAFNFQGGNGAGIAPGIGGSGVLDASGRSAGAGGGGGGHGGGYGKYGQCNAYFYGAGGGGIQGGTDKDGNVVTTIAGQGADGVIALVFTPI